MKLWRRVGQRFGFCEIKGRASASLLTLVSLPVLGHWAVVHSCNGWNDRSSSLSANDSEQRLLATFKPRHLSDGIVFIGACVEPFDSTMFQLALITSNSEMQ
jgi:hypothetical protein